MKHVGGCHLRPLKPEPQASNTRSRPVYQIENEYQNVEASFHENGPPYVRWAAKMALGLHAGVPWVMCKQDDAPGSVINSCNGMRCGETFVGPNSPNKPSIWTENWTSFYQVFGEDAYMKSAENIAFHVALFIAKKKGSYVNYYMPAVTAATANTCSCSSYE